jgi:hypothetical protein
VKRTEANEQTELADMARTAEAIKRDLEHEERNLSDRQRELMTAHQVLEVAIWQRDNARKSVARLRTELVESEGDDDGTER